MAWEPVEVAARWEARGWFLPQRFTWNGEDYPVESTGRQWEDEEGLHVLCMVPGAVVYELVFRLQPAGWWLRPTASGFKAV
jgi:hypothetical protein